MALKSDGTLWAWGRNQYGQLGDGTTTNRNSPVQVSGITGAEQIAIGNSNGMALKTDGTVWAWGSVYPKSIPRDLLPIQIGSGVDSIAAGDACSFITIGNDVYGLGLNTEGQMGLYYKDEYPLPFECWTGYGDDCGDTLKTAYVINKDNKSFNISGYLNHYTDIDMFQFTSDISKAYFVTIDTNNSMVANILDENGTVITSLEDGVDIDLVQGKNYYVEVKYGNLPSSSSGAYLMHIVEDDHDDTFGTATQISDINTNYSASGIVNHNTDIDMFKITATSSGIYCVFIPSNCKDGITVTFYDVNGTQIATIGDGMTIDLVQGEVYYLEIKHSNSVSTSEVSYLVNLGRDDYGDTFGTSTTISILNDSYSISGVVNSNSDIDMFRFTADTSDYYFMSTSSNNSGALKVTLFDEEEVEVEGFELMGTCLYNLVQGENYYLRVKYNDSITAAAISTYTIRLSKDDYGNTFEDSNQINAVNNSYSVFGIIHNQDIDMLQFTSPETKNYYITILSEVDGSISATLYDINRNPVEMLQDGSVIDLIQGQSYFIEVKPVDLSTPLKTEYMIQIASDDHGNTFETASIINLNNNSYNASGIINAIMDIDMLRFVVDTSKTYTVSLDAGNNNEEIAVTLYDENKTILQSIHGSTSIDLTQGQTYYIGLKYNSSASPFSEIAYSVQIQQLSGMEKILDCILDESIYVPLRVINATNLNDKVFTLNYSVQDLDIIDLVSQTKALETTAGIVTGSSIEILSCIPGKITFKVVKKHAR